MRVFKEGIQSRLTWSEVHVCFSCKFMDFHSLNLSQFIKVTYFAGQSKLSCQSLPPPSSSPQLSVLVAQLLSVSATFVCCGYFIPWWCVVFCGCVLKVWLFSNARQHFLLMRVWLWFAYPPSVVGPLSGSCCLDIMNNAAVDTGNMV